MSIGEADPCPSPEVLGKFLEGTLWGDERQAVIRHLSGCAECRFVVESAAEVMDEDAVARVVVAAPKRRYDWRVLLPVAAVVAIVLVGIPVMLRQRPSPGPEAIVRLASAMPSAERSIAPRLSGFRWAPLRDVRRGDPAKKSPAELIAAGAAGDVLRDVDAHRSAEDAHAAGVAYLVAGEPKKAIAFLEEATKRATGNARAWADLSAALYSDADPRDDSAGLQAALDAANRAISLDAGLPEPYFNRALALERMGSKADAEKAWRDSLAHDPASQWAAEAQTRLRNLQRQPAA